MSERSAELLIEDIIESGLKILSYTNGLTYEEFIQDSKTVDAVIRNFEIIGEASNRLPEKFKSIHRDIDWHRIKGFRNRIVHHYFGIDLKIIWQIIKSYLPEMINKLKTITNS